MDPLISLQAPWSCLDTHTSLLFSRVLAELRTTSAETIINFRDQSISSIESAPGAVRYDGTVAIVPVHGAMMRTRDAFTDYFDIQTYDALIDRFNSLRANTAITAVILDIDSPGGHAQGLEYVAEALSALRDVKPVRAQISGLCASAAYYIACYATDITADPSSVVGSVGTVMTLYDFSKYFNELGIEPHVARSGPFKHRPTEGEAIDAEAMTPYQNIVDSLAAHFFSVVGITRGLSGAALDAVTDGRVWPASDGHSLGLIDAIGTHFDMITPITDSVASAAGAHSIITSGDSDMPAKVKTIFPSSTAPTPIVAGATDAPIPARPEPVESIDPANQATPALAAATTDQRLGALQAAFPDQPQIVLDQLSATAGLSLDAVVVHARAAQAEALVTQLASAQGTIADLRAQISAASGSQVPATAADAAAPAAGITPLLPQTPQAESADTAAVAQYDAEIKRLRASGDMTPARTIACMQPDLAAAYIAAVQPT